MFKTILSGIILTGIIVPAVFAGDKSKISSEMKVVGKNKPKQIDRLLVKFEVIRGKGQKVYSSKVMVADGQGARIRFIDEKFFPVAWKAPAFTKLDSKRFKLISALPVFGKPTAIGMQFFITPKIIKHPEKGKIIFAYGKIISVNSSKNKKITSPGIKEKGMQHSISSNITSFVLYFADKNEQEISFNHENSLYKVKIYCKEYENK